MGRVLSEIELWTDGSSTGAVGDGGWAYILRYGERQKGECGYAPDTTNNRMELTALLMGLRALKRPGLHIRVFTDSEYVMFPFTKGWLRKWRENDWMTGRGGKRRRVSNPDLWEALWIESRNHRLTFEWVKGHAGVLLNEECDKAAVTAKKAGIGAYVEVPLPELASLELELA